MPFCPTEHFLPISKFPFLAQPSIRRCHKSMDTFRSLSNADLMCFTNIGHTLMCPSDSKASNQLVKNEGLLPFTLDIFTRPALSLAMRGHLQKNVVFCPQIHGQNGRNLSFAVHRLGFKVFLTYFCQPATKGFKYGQIRNNNRLQLRTTHATIIIGLPSGRTHAPRLPVLTWALQQQESLPRGTGFPSGKHSWRCEG